MRAAERTVQQLAAARQGFVSLSDPCPSAGPKSTALLLESRAPHHPVAPASPVTQPTPGLSIFAPTSLSGIARNFNSRPTQTHFHEPVRLFPFFFVCSLPLKLSTVKLTLSFFALRIQQQNVGAG